MKQTNYFLVLLIIFILVSCSSEEHTGRTAAEVLFKDAKSQMKDGRYIMATETLNNLRTLYPYSIYSVDAELTLADIAFLQESYVEAAASYTVFRDFHPKNPKLDYVLYRIADSYYHQIPETFDRDLSNAIETSKHFKSLLLSFPGTKHKKEALEKIAYCNKMLQEKEKYIADFYFKTKVYDAAIYRYEAILKEFTNQSIKDHAKKRIVEAAYISKDLKNCKKYTLKYYDYLKTVTSLKEIVSKCSK
jgi:outer membrane protein assembly factor BamD